MAFITVNRCELHYEIEGDGSPIVFVHGESHGSEMFRHPVAHLSGRYKCLTYYRRGHGKSALPPYGYSMWNQMIDLAELLERLEIRDAVFVGVAMSTPLISTYAMHHPGNVRALVLSSWYEITGFPLLEKHRKTGGVFMGEIRERMAKILETQGREALENWVESERDAMFPIFPVAPGPMREVARMFASHPLGHYIKSAEYYTSLPNLLPQMHQIECPILGICGTEDPSPDEPKLLAHMPNFRQEWIPGSRRFPMVEDPKAFNAVLDRFLAELRPPTR